MTKLYALNANDVTLKDVFERWPAHQMSPTPEAFMKEIGVYGHMPPTKYVNLVQGRLYPDEPSAAALAALADHQGLISTEDFLKLARDARPKEAQKNPASQDYSDEADAIAAYAAAKARSKALTDYSAKKKPATKTGWQPEALSLSPEAIASIHKVIANTEAWELTPSATSAEGATAQPLSDIRDALTPHMKEIHTRQDTPIPETESVDKPRRARNPRVEATPNNQLGKMLEDIRNEQNMGIVAFSTRLGTKTLESYNRLLENELSPRQQEEYFPRVAKYLNDRNKMLQIPERYSTHEIRELYETPVQKTVPNSTISEIRTLEAKGIPPAQSKGANPER
jgi:hypothetical protein